MTIAALDAARDAFSRKAWPDAFESFTAAGETLAPEDLESLAICAAMLERSEDSAEAWTRAYNAWLEVNRPRAARCAFWLGVGLLNQGERARSSMTRGSSHGRDP